MAAWRLAYQAFGARPKRTRPSVEALAELGPGGLTEAGRDLAGQLAALHPGAGLSWRQVGGR